MTTPYRGVILEHFRRPRNRGTLPAPDVSVDGANPLCGDRVRLQLAITADHVTEARFTADACAICVASASLLMSFIEGALLSAARSVDEGTLLQWLETEIPTARRDCAVLPLETLRRALREWRGNPRAPADSSSVDQGP